MYYDCGGEWGPVTFPAFKAFFGLCLEKSSHANTRHFNEMRKQPRATTRLVAPRIAKRSDPRSDTRIASGGQIEELASTSPPSAHHAPSFRPHHQTIPTVAVFCCLLRTPWVSVRKDRLLEESMRHS